MHETDRTPPPAAESALEAAQRTIAQLRSALNGREVVAQATGVLVARRRIEPSAAFALLRRAAQDNNVKLVRLARALVDRTAGAAPVDPDLRLVVDALHDGRQGPARLAGLQLAPGDQEILAGAEELLAAERDAMPAGPGSSRPAAEQTA